MQILITQQPDDGKFTIGQTYEVIAQHRLYVCVIDDVGNTEPVYNYQFTTV